MNLDEIHRVQALANLAATLLNTGNQQARDSASNVLKLIDAAVVPHNLADTGQACAQSTDNGSDNARGMTSIEAAIVGLRQAQEELDKANIASIEHEGSSEELRQALSNAVKDLARAKSRLHQEITGRPDTFSV